MADKSFNSKRFRNIGVLTIASVYFLILVGGIVRSTGSGMGCPDWPRCFGSWIPPTNVNQLPDDYLEVYRDKRIQKNQKLAGYLNKLGFNQIAQQLLQHPTAYLETEFNVQKTWIEYVNRLVGVFIGIFIILTFLISFSYFKKDRSIFYLSFFSVILVIFQGWLGSLVVSTNLLPIMVTIHMALALLMVGVLIYAIARSQVNVLKQRLFVKSRLMYLMLWLVILFTFAQTLLGTQVREMIDQISFNLNYLYREKWISQLDLSFYVHRSFSSIVLLVNLYLAYQLFRIKDGYINKLLLLLVFLLVLEIVFGVIMVEYSIPAFLQPLHLVTATLIFGVQFFLLIIYHYAARYKPVAHIVA